MTARRYLRTAFGLVVGLAFCAAPGADAQSGDSLNPLKALDKATLKGFLEQPLFDPARRLPPVVSAPAVAAAAPVAAPPEPPPTLHLLGVIHGLRDIAIVHRDNDRKTVILHTGDRVGAWKVTVLPSAGVRLRNGDRAFDYALFAKPGAGVGPVAAEPEPDFGGLPGVSTPTMDARNARLQRRTY